MEFEVELGIAVLTRHWLSRELLFTQEKGVFAEDILAEILWQIYRLGDLHDKVHSLTDQICWIFWDHIIGDLRFTVNVHRNDVELKFTHNFRVRSNYWNGCWVVHKIGETLKSEISLSHLNGFLGHVEGVLRILLIRLGQFSSLLILVHHVFDFLEFVLKLLEWPLEDHVAVSVVDLDLYLLAGCAHDISGWGGIKAEGVGHYWDELLRELDVLVHELATLVGLDDLALDLLDLLLKPVSCPLFLLLSVVYPLRLLSILPCLLLDLPVYLPQTLYLLIDLLILLLLRDFILLQLLNLLLHRLFVTVIHHL